MEHDPMSRLWQGGAWEHPQSVPAVPSALPGARARSAGTKKRRRRRGLGTFVVFLALIVGLTALTAAVSHFGIPDQILSLLPRLPEAERDYGFTYPNLTQTPAQATTIPRAAAGGSARLILSQEEGEKLSLQDIYEKSLPSIVYIQAQQVGSVNSGTGVILSADGYILTNEHVISGAHSAYVVLQNNTRLQAKLVGVHADHDLAVLKVEAGGLTPAEFGNSADMRVGDSVVAIGNPLGSTLRNTMTEGIISAINRPVDVDGTSMSLIQTTAALNPGNSGGALINDRGQVIGITTLKMMSESETLEGLGFAIPTRFAKGIVDQIIATGVARTPALGITCRMSGEGGGLLVLTVDQRSDAWTKGLQPGDIIVAAEGVAIRDIDTLSGIKETMGVDDVITLTVRRGSEEFDLEIILVDADTIT